MVACGVPDRPTSKTSAVDHELCAARACAITTHANAKDFQSIVQACISDRRNAHIGRLDRLDGYKLPVKLLGNASRDHTVPPSPS